MKHILSIIYIFIMLMSCSHNRSGYKKDPLPVTSGISPVNDKGDYIGLIDNDSTYIKYEKTGDGLYLTPQISVGDVVIYKDTSDNYYDLDDENVKIIKLKKYSLNYILLTLFDPVAGDRWLVLTVRKRNYERANTIIKGVLSDLDNDSYIEVGGRNLVESNCDKCDSMYYEPFHIYELGNGIHYEKSLSKEITMDLYNGTYLGEDRIDSIKLRYNTNFDFTRFDY